MFGKKWVCGKTELKILQLHLRAIICFLNHANLVVKCTYIYPSRIDIGAEANPCDGHSLSQSPIRVKRWIAYSSQGILAISNASYQL